MTWLLIHLPRRFPTLKQSISLLCLAYNQLEGGVLEYSRSIKPTAESTAEVWISFYGIQVCSYLLPTRHWTWRYIAIANSWVFSLQLLCTHWPTYAYLLTITIVIYLVLSLYLTLTNARVAHTITYLHIYFVYLLRNNYRIILSRLHCGRSWIYVWRSNIGFGGSGWMNTYRSFLVLYVTLI